MKYKEDFENMLSHFVFLAMVPDIDPIDRIYIQLKAAADSGGFDYSRITKAAKEDKENIPESELNIPIGEYKTTLDFSSIEDNTVVNVKRWKEIGFADGKQVVTINVVVGTKWADDKEFEKYKIKTVSPDNVTFNLFDYWVENETAHTHQLSGTENTNTRPTCGIPSCTGETDKVVNDNYKNTNFYNKGINENHALVFSPAGDQSGGWNFNTSNSLHEWFKDEKYEKLRGGPYTGLVKNTLGEDGYPTLKLEQNEVNSKEALKPTENRKERPANESLAYLFDETDTNSKKVYKNVKGLLKRDQETGNYMYSSLKNFASFDKTKNSFNVYNSWAVQGGSSEEGQFFPFNTATQVFENNEGKPEVNKDGNLKPNSDVNGQYSAFLNHYLGLTMEVDFLQPVGGKISNMGAENPMKFRFTGDDDVWIFIDDVLVADLGGIHDSMTTTIDFSTGDVKVYRTAELKVNKDPRTETTIKDQFEEAQGENLNESDFKGETFADNSTHTLKMFYMERGNLASNLELEFNLMAPDYNKLYKVDQDGKGLKDVTFGLYEANNNWTPVGDILAELTTDKDGYVEFAKEENGKKKAIVFDEKKNYILREIETPEGYVTQGDIHIKYQAKTGTLDVINKWETGAVDGFDARVTMTTDLYYANKQNPGEKDKEKDKVPEDVARKGLIVAVPLYNPAAEGLKAKEGWQALYGSVYKGFKAVSYDKENKNLQERYLKMIIEASIAQFSDPEYERWNLNWNDDLQRYEGTFSHLPGSVERYVFVDRDKGDMVMAYYLFTPEDGLFEDDDTIKENAKLAELASEPNAKDIVDKYYKNIRLLNLDDFNRQFYTNMYISNKVRDLSILKVDENRNPIQGAEFTLYSDEGCTTPVAKGITDENGYLSFSAEYKGNNASTSRVYYPLAQNIDENGKTSEKHLWMKETKAPEGYDINPTVTKVLVSNDGIYVDAGTKYDNVSVAKGIGKLVKTMLRYASDDVVNVTLRDIIATKYKYNGALKEDGFPNVSEANNWKKDESEEPLNLHFGLDSAILDYGVHEANRKPVFETDEGWISVGVKQNYEYKDDKSNAIKENISNEKIADLFTGSTVVIVKNEKTPTGGGDEDPNYGSLTITKEVTGTNGDRNKEFNFTITLDNKNINGTYSNVVFKDGVAKVTLKHGEKVTITRLPSDVGYTVTEDEANKDGYTTSSKDATGKILANKTATVTFTNEKNDNPDPDKPGYDPDKPGKDPDDPGKDPDNPGKDPDNPSKDPDNPGKDPDNPSKNPGNPGGGTNTPTTNTSKSGDPTTGDQASLGLFASLFAISGLGIVALRRKH